MILPAITKPEMTKASFGSVFSFRHVKILDAIFSELGRVFLDVQKSIKILKS